MTTTQPTVSAPSISRDRQLDLYRRAIQHLPGGTDSNFRAWGEDTIYVDRGQGGLVWDMDGNEFVDLRMGYGPVILGHGDARVDDYVNERMRRGVSFSLTSEDEVRTAELIAELTGWVEMARMTVSGTEATMHAMRLARAYTGRDKIVKFEGQYHGVHDYALISVGPNDMSELGTEDNPVAPRLGPGHPGVRRRDDHPGPLQQHRVPALAVRAPRRGDRGDHRRARARQRAGDPPAAGLPPGDAGAHRGVRHPPDLRRGQDRLPPRQGRRRRVLRHHARPRDLRQGDGQWLPGRGVRRPARGHGLLPDKVSHGGTYAGNRVAAAAAVKTLEILRDTDALETIHATGRRVQAGLPRSSTRPGCRTRSRAIPRCSGSCSPSRSRSIATGRTPTTSSTTRSPSACTPAARCPSPTVANRGSCARRTRGRPRRPGPDAFEESLEAALDARAHGEHDRDERRQPGAARLTGDRRAG